jgi:hypothetical protein
LIHRILDTMFNLFLNCLLLFSQQHMRLSTSLVKFQFHNKHFLHYILKQMISYQISTKIFSMRESIRILERICNMSLVKFPFVSISVLKICIFVALLANTYSIVFHRKTHTPLEIFLFYIFISVRRY